MYKLVILTTGDEWEFNNFGELVFAALECYDGIDDNVLLCEILENLAKLEKGEISNFSTENDEGIWVYRMWNVED